MLLPVGDTPNPENYFPWGNWLLIAANVAVYVLVTWPLSHKGVNPSDPALYEYLRVIGPRLPRGLSLPQLLQHISAYDLYVFKHGFKPAAPEIRDLFYSLFLHGGFMHLFGNMLFLWIYGDNVEHRLGHLFYIVVYIFCGVCATLFFALFTRASMTPLVGASGAISGTLGLYYLFFPRNRIKVFIFFFPFFMDVFLIPARIVLGFYLLIDNLLPFMLSSSAGGVAHGAHIGGFLAGLACAWGFERLEARPDYAFRQSTPEPPPGTSFAAPPPPLARLQRALDRSDREAAFAVLGELDPNRLMTLTADEIVRLADWLRQSGHHRSADSLLRSYLKSHVGSPELAKVFLALGRARIAEGQAPSAYQYLLEGLDHHPDPATEAALREALAQVDNHWNKK